jgi:hypothetical protein
MWHKRLKDRHETRLIAPSPKQDLTSKPDHCNDCKRRGKPPTNEIVETSATTTRLPTDSTKSKTDMLQSKSSDTTKCSTRFVFRYILKLESNDKQDGINLCSSIPLSPAYSVYIS